MGFLRTVVLYNDSWHQNTIRKNPEQFLKELTEAMDYADEHNTPYIWGSGIQVYPSRHADDHTVLIHYGNTVVDIAGRRFQEQTMKEMPDVAKRYLNIAQQIVTWAKKRLTEQTKKTPIKP